MSKLNWNRGKSSGGGSQVSNLAGEARFFAAHGLMRPRWSIKTPTTPAGKTKALKRLAKANMAAEKGRKIHRAIFGVQEKRPKGCIRLAKEDPSTHVVNIVDLPITQRSLGLILDKIAKKQLFKAADFGLYEEELEFIRTGRCEGKCLSNLRM
jgi:hypothetical protein